MRAEGSEVLVVESHEPYRMKSLLEKAGFGAEDLTLPVLSDPAQTAAASYGVAFQMDDTIEWADRTSAFLID